ncbi:hypothetical protein V8E54_007801 [Elaphomyces granulatus]
MLDEIHPDLPTSSNDENTYVLGRVWAHNIVIACLPFGVYGTTSAATVASQMRFTFKSIRFRLTVGIGGGAPNRKADIRLGDVVVSKPTGGFGGVVQYDFGKAAGQGVFERTGRLNRPPQIFLTAIARLQADQMMKTSQIPEFLSVMKATYLEMRAEFAYRGQEQDRLFDATFDHCGLEDTCDGCEINRLVARPARDRDDPVIHYGLIASGNQVMEHGGTRDKLGQELGVLCFEMEAAGLMDNFPCLVIRGICDYADSHKNKEWQGYAAATAAAYAKELLSVIHPNQVGETLNVMTDKDNCCLADLLLTDPRNEKIRIELTKGGLLKDSFRWILDNSEFQRWRGDKQSQLLWIKGDAGKGKTMLMIGIVDELEQQVAKSSVSEVLSYFLCQGTDSRLNSATAILRGIIYLLASEHPFLISHLRKKYDHAGRKLFDDSGAFYGLCDASVPQTLPCTVGVLEHFIEAGVYHTTTAWVMSVAFSPDGKKVVSGFYDSTVQVWDIATGQADQTLTGHSAHVTSVALSPDGKKVVSGSNDSTVWVWDITTGQVDQTLTGHSGEVSSVAFSPNGKKVVSHYSDSTVRVWDITTGQAEQVGSVPLSPDGTVVLAPGSCIFPLTSDQKSLLLVIMLL